MSMPEPDINWRKSSYSNGAGGDCVEVSWRKSSYSDASGGNCVEVGWRKSRRSNGANGNCVEVAVGVEGVAVRDSKNVTGPVLSFGPGSWAAFLAGERPADGKSGD